MDKRGKLTIIFGGQWGSEGKGEVAAFITKHEQVDVGVRIGGPNAGHTSYDFNGNKVMVQSLPTPTAINGEIGVIGAEGAVIPGMLLQELKDYRTRNGGGQRIRQLIIDECAAIITDEHMAREQALKGSIGSTGEGVGAATADKVMRVPDLIAREQAYKLVALLGSEVERFYIAHTPTFLNGMLDKGRHLLLEGTQGLLLSLHTSGYYPFCTSRECSPAALLAGTGINYRNAGDFRVIMVVRTYPIRVGGNSGPLPNEITWEELNKRIGKPVEPEKTTVTKKIRRIGAIDMRTLMGAVKQTGPDELAVTFLDYVFPEYANTVFGTNGMSSFQDLPSEVKEYLSSFLINGCKVGYITTGPNSTTRITY